MTFSTKRILSVHYPVPRSEGGFTLIELLVTLAIAVILAAIAVPSFRTMNRNMAVSNAADELVTGIQFARSEAIRTNRTVTLSFDGRTWRVFIDTNNNHVFDQDSEVLLRESSYSELMNAQQDTLWFNFAPLGTITSSLVTFPADICLTTADNQRQRQIRFPARASSPIIQTSCSN